MKSTEETLYDVFLFIGQSNMAGRGVVSERWPEPAPVCVPGAGFEFRAVSDPTRLYPVEEPFGLDENREGGILEAVRKTGSMVTSFVNAYYEASGVPVIGISASRGGSEIAEWAPSSAYLNDTLRRLDDAAAFLARQGYRIRHKYMLWCQGETDGDRGTPSDRYKAVFHAIARELSSRGIERCFMVRIGHYNSAAAPDAPVQDYSVIMRVQDELAREDPFVTMTSTKFSEMRERGLMKDAFHYYQQAYNEVGAEAGRNAAGYAVGRN